MDGDAEEFHGVQTVGPHHKFGSEVKNRSSAKDSVPERLRCETIQKEVIYIL